MNKCQNFKITNINYIYKIKLLNQIENKYLMILIHIYI